MQGMLAAAPAKLIELQTIGIVSAVLLGRVVAFLAFVTLQVNHHADVFLSHVILSERALSLECPCYNQLRPNPESR